MQIADLKISAAAEKEIFDFIICIATDEAKIRIG